MPYRQLLPLLAAAAKDEEQASKIAQSLDIGTRNIINAVRAAPFYNLAQNGSQQAQRRRRDTSSIACNMCRAKKTACDRLRPNCTLCTERKTRCIYRTNHRTVEPSSESSSPGLRSQLEVLQQRVRDQNDMIQALASLPSGAALDVLRILRTAQDPFSVLASLQGSMHGHQRPSDHRAARGTAPPTFSKTEFELASLHPAVYLSLQPIDNASLRALIQSNVPILEDIGPAEKSDAGSLPSSEYASPALNSLPSPQSTSFGSADTTPSWHLDPSELMLDQSRRPSQDATQDSDTEHASISAFGPEPFEDYYDPRLKQISIEYWTHASITNELAASILSFYLRYDHTLFSIFDTDLFLADLVNCRSEFCSAFLVNSIMLLACQSYTAINMNAALLVHQFFREAKNLWRGQGATPSLIAIAACEIFSMGCYFYGQDDLALEALTQGRRMAENMHLFGPLRDQSAVIDHFQQQSQDWLRAASHTAWGTHNWLSCHVFYYNGEPVQEPPILPMPGSTEPHTNGTSQAGWASQAYWSHHDNKDFSDSCRFWTIVQEVAVVYLGPHIDRSRPLSEQVPLAFAEEKYQKLLAWADTMVGIIDDRRSPRILLYQYVMLTWFHCTVLHLFRPFLKEAIGATETASRRLNSFSAVDGCPETIFDASIRQLKQLIYLYVSRASDMPLSGYCNAAFVVVGHAMLQGRRYHRRYRLGSTDSGTSLETNEDYEAGDSQGDSQGEEQSPRRSSLPASNTQGLQKVQDEDVNARLYFLLCVRAWIDLYVCYPTFLDFIQAFLSMALEADLLTASEAHAILASLRERGRHHAVDATSNVSSLIDFDLALSHPEEASVNTLALKFNDLAAFNEFTSAEDFIM